MIAYFCHPDDFAVFSGWYFFALMFRSLLPEISFMLLKQ